MHSWFLFRDPHFAVKVYQIFRSTFTNAEMPIFWPKNLTLETLRTFGHSDVLTKRQEKYITVP